MNDSARTPAPTAGRRLGRRAFLQQTGGIVVAAGFAGALLDACGTSAAGSGSATPAINPAHLRGALKLIAWQSYEGNNDPSVVAWRKASNITLTESPLSQNDQILTELRAGGIGKYNLVTPNVAYAPLLLQAGVIQAVDYSLLPNVKNYLPAIRRTSDSVSRINGKQYAVPFLWGYDGMVYNATTLGTAPASWKDVLKSKYAGRIVLLSGVNPNFEIWPRVLGYDLARLTKPQLQNVVKFLIHLKKTQVRTVTPDPTEAADILARGDADIIASGTFIGNTVTASKGNKLAATLPAEGGATWIDSYAIPVQAGNLDTVYGFINHMLSVPVQVFIGDQNVEGATNQLAVRSMSAANRKLFLYSNATIGSSRAPLWQLPVNSGPNSTSYDDWLHAWDQIQQA